VSRAQISLIESGKADPRMSTVTRILTSYGASLSDLESSPPKIIRLGELKERAGRAAARLEDVGLGPSDPMQRLDRKAQRQEDVRAEREALASRS